MKIKTDFVTNSSSTSYILTSNVSGWLPRLSSNYSDLKKFYENQEYLYKKYAHILLKAEEHEPQTYYTIDAEKRFDLDILLSDTVHSIKGDQVDDITLFNLEITNYNPYHFDQIKLTKQIIEELLFKQLKETISPSQLMYFSYPSSITGDGWDGGDPMGPSSKYNFKYEVYKNETRMGIFSIVNSVIITEIGCLDSQLSINQITLDQINQAGFPLEEQNDKNS